MKRAVAITVILVLGAALAAAVDVAGTMSVGYDGSRDGVTVRVYGDGVGFEALLGSTVEIDSASTDILARPGVRVLMPLQLSPDANLNVFGGVDFVADMQGIGATPTNSYDVIAQVGLAPEIFLLTRLSVETSVGLEVSLTDLGGTPITGIELFGGGVSISGGVNFHWYLRR